MSIKTTLSISEARKRIFDLTKKVQSPHRVYTLTENGIPKAVLMSAEEFESWLETLEVADLFPDLEKDIQKAQKDINTGSHKNDTTLEELVKKMS